MLLSFPVTMQVTILPGGNLVGIDIEGSFGRLTGVQELTIRTAVGNNLHPFDIVFLFHGMGYIANLDLETTGNFLHHRYVFFFCSVNGVLCEQNHGLAAANQFTGTTVQKVMFGAVAEKVSRLANVPTMLIKHK